MTAKLLTLRTEHCFQCMALTKAVHQFVRERNGNEGAVVVSGQHTTTALIINELEERLLLDLERWLCQIAPPSLPWKHNDLERRSGIPDDEPRNAHAHLQALLLGNQVVINVSQGELVLGRYQDVILVELDGPRERTVCLQWLQGCNSSATTSPHRG